MPFIKQTNLKGPQPLIESHDRIFVGRTVELLFFRDHILQPTEPAYNIVSISGNAGVGKTTLLNQVINLVQAPNFKDYILTALVDSRQVSPDSVMTQFVLKLPKKGHVFRQFENILGRYREDLHQQQDQREAEHKDIEQAATGILDTAIGAVPGPVGSVLKPVAGGLVQAIFDFFMRKYEDHHRLREASQLDDPMNDLTQTFVAGLNRLARDGYRILLFFDTFGQLAPTISPWLLDTFLEANIDTNVVLVIAGRAPIEVSTPDGYKRWQKYHDNHNLYSISLKDFTEEETEAYLKIQGITDPGRIHSIWQVSRGLPYYLALLTSNRQGDVDPTMDIVDNFLRRIPDQEQIKRQLVLEVALLTRPFNQDDLVALPNLSGQNIPALYDWLIGQPFVHRNPRNGRYYYDELAQQLFCRALYQRTTNEYQDIRRVLAKHYQEQCAKLEKEEGREAYGSSEWRELVVALVNQLFLLPDQTSHVQAIGLATRAYVHIRHVGEIVKVLRELSRDQPDNLASPNARAIAAKLQKCIDSDLASQDFLEANSYILDEAAHEPSFPPELLATLYLLRGQAYSALHQYNQAIQDYDQAIALAPNDALGYSSRGLAYRLQRDYQRAIQDFDQAITLDVKNAWTFAQRALAYRHLNKYGQAIVDFNHTIVLNPNFAWAYGQRGKTYQLLKNYPQAIQDCDQAIKLNARNAWAFAQRGLTYLWLNEVSQAQADFVRSWEIDPKHITYGWMKVWSEMCQQRTTSGVAEPLEAIAVVDPQSYVAHVCQGTALWLRKSAEQALTELEQAISLESEMWDAHFWKGMVYASLGQDEDATKEVEKALEVGLPPAFLTPLCWFEQDRSEFYEKYAKPLLNRFSEHPTYAEK